MCKVPASSAALLMGAPDVGDPQRERRKGHLVPGGTAEGLLPVDGAWGTRLELVRKEKRCWRQGSGETEGNQEFWGRAAWAAALGTFRFIRLGSRHCSGYLCCSWVPDNLSLLGPYSADFTEASFCFPVAPQVRTLMPGTSSL